MPRRHGSARERASAPSPRPPASLAPRWAQAQGYVVRQVAGDRSYRCPGCDHEIRNGTSHLVVMPEGSADLRRHWHTPCWERELRRLS
ncbi:MAG: hypothetical protein ACRDHM_03060 [Actinomycetota bacterium]